MLMVELDRETTIHLVSTLLTRTDTRSYALIFHQPVKYLSYSLDWPYPSCRASFCNLVVGPSHASHTISWCTPPSPSTNDAEGQLSWLRVFLSNYVFTALPAYSCVFEMANSHRCPLSCWQVYQADDPIQRNKSPIPGILHQVPYLIKNNCEEGAIFYPGDPNTPKCFRGPGQPPEVLPLNHMKIVPILSVYSRLHG